MAPKIKKEIKYWAGVGRRKESVARVRIYEDVFGALVNDKTFMDFFPSKEDQKYILAPLKILKMDKKITFSVVVSGGGLTGWQGAIRLGLSRALLKYNLAYRSELKSAGFLTRDSRIVERKKAGFIKARKKPKFSKR